MKVETLSSAMMDSTTARVNSSMSLTNITSIEAGSVVSSSNRTLIAAIAGGVITLIFLIVFLILMIDYGKKRKKTAYVNEEFDIINLHAGEKTCLMWDSGIRTYPNVDFFVPEMLPVVYQQQPEIGPFSLYEIQKEDDETSEKYDQVGDIFASPAGTPVGTPVLNRSSDRWKSSLRRRISTTSASDLDVGLYTNGEEEETCGLTTIRSRGRLHLSVIHDTVNHCAVINILSAASLKLKKVGKSIPDTCVRLEIADDNGNYPELSHFSPIFSGTHDPEYNISFCVNLVSGGDEQMEAYSQEKKELDEGRVRLEVALCIADRFSRVNEVGRVVMSLEEVSHYAGGHGRMLDMWRDIIPNLEDVTSQGELFISLCYNPQLKSLSACVVRARSLVPPQAQSPTLFPNIEDNIGLVYVKLTMVSSGTVLKRRKSSIQLHSVTPALNDQHSFDVGPDMLDDVTIVFTVFSRNGQGHRMMLGKTNVGSAVYTTGVGLEHWEATISKPEVSVFRWHMLF